MRKGDVKMEISSKEEAVEHFTKVKQLEKIGLKAKISFSTQHSSVGDYFVIEIEPRLFYVLANGEITSELPT
jgi:hypothetical protein